MKITGELLKAKGFELKIYPKLTFWEYTTSNKKIMENILQEDYSEDEYEVCLRLNKDFTEKN
ncbi:MAG: hypothetical protein LIR50_14960 [Bacillota bacterium]|nr:hypothetical protein [Bacillota bacterium]